jgi:nucleoside-diphosphate kinase
MERTFAYLKPNAIQRGLVGEIIRRIEEKGLKILALKMLMISESKARELYREHAGKDFYEPLLGFIQSGPVVAIVLEGEDAVQRLRILIGKNRSGPGRPGKYSWKVRRLRQKEPHPRFRQY